MIYYLVKQPIGPYRKKTKSWRSKREDEGGRGKPREDTTAASGRIAALKKEKMRTLRRESTQRGRGRSPKKIFYLYGQRRVPSNEKKGIRRAL